MNQTVDIEKVDSLMTLALENGSTAFSAFVGRNVSVQNSTTHALDNSLWAMEEEELIILVSELKGDIKGKSYLIFTKKEAQKFCSLSLSAEHCRDQEMFHAMLLEFDNIITAAVVTKISETLKAYCYAYVPEIYELKSSAVHEFMNKEHLRDTFSIQTNAKFLILDWECNPFFIWVFDNSISKSENL